VFDISHRLEYWRVYGDVATSRQSVVCSGAVAALSSTASQSLVGRGVARTRKPTSLRRDFFCSSVSVHTQRDIQTARTHTKQTEGLQSFVCSNELTGHISVVSDGLE